MNWLIYVKVKYLHLKAKSSIKNKVYTEYRGQSRFL